MKNNKIKRIIACILAIAATVSCFAGCKNSEVENPDKKVTLKYLMPGPGMQQDSEKVWGVLNEKLASDIPGLEIDFEIIPLSEYKQNFMLMLSAREKVDIANNYSLDFSTEVRNGTFEPLNDLLDEYGKGIKDAFPEWFLNYQNVDGKIYGIPSYQMCAALRAVAFFKDEAEKYLDIEAFKKELYKSHTFDNKKLYDMLEKYILDMKADGKTFKDATIFNTRGYDYLIQNYAVVYGDEAKVVNLALDEQAKIRYEVAADWFKKGYIRQDVMSATNRGEYIGKDGGVPFWDEIYTPFVAEQLNQKYDKEVLLIPYHEKDYIGYQNSAKGTSIVVSCEDKVKAMKFLNLLQTNKDYFNLLTFGVEGEHYKKTGDDSIEVSYNGSATSNDKYGLYKWCVGNTELAYNIQTEPAEYKDWVFNQSNKSDFVSPLIGFNVDTTNIQDYITQVNVVTSKYYQPLLEGVNANWEEEFKKMETELNKVGNQQIIDELQKQVDEFLKNK